jgi:hypothetical protein
VCIKLCSRRKITSAVSVEGCLRDVIRFQVLLSLGHMLSDKKVGIFQEKPPICTDSFVPIKLLIKINSTFSVRGLEGHKLGVKKLKN